MTLHRDPAAFREAIVAAAAALGLRQDLVEKDYWVTWVLRNLAGSDIADRVVFKGGTSLSKAWKLIARFSEDVDLAVIPDAFTNAAMKRIIRHTHEMAVARATPDELPELPGTTKLGRNRSALHAYPKMFANAVAPIAMDHLLLEITCFGQPHPHVTLPLTAYVGDYLLHAAGAEVVRAYGLEAFNFPVLTLGRTVAEKILALVRASYHADPAAEVARKVRHLYDLHHLYAHPYVQALTEAELFGLLRAVQADDATTGVIGPTHDWKRQPLGACWAFAADAANLRSAALRQAYQRQLPELVHQTAPSFTDMGATMAALAALLQRYDALPPIARTTL